MDKSAVWNVLKWEGETRGHGGAKSENQYSLAIFALPVRGRMHSGLE